MSTAASSDGRGVAGPEEGKRPRRRRLRSTAVLPGLFTLANGLAGFAAIHYATKDGFGQAQPQNLSAAAWLIFVAMIFDLLDGRLARITRRTSDFGGQLDSLCDAVSFGVAPATLMLRTEATALRGQIERVSVIPHAIGLERAVWGVAGVYVACAILRLARFNVENEPDESSHLTFRGLPTPGAAAMVAALVLLFDHLAGLEAGWRSGGWMLATVGITLPLATLAVALLMVSRFTYPHLPNQYMRGKRPFNYLVKLVLVALLAMLELYIALAAATIAYAFSGPALWLWRRARADRTAKSAEGGA